MFGVISCNLVDRILYCPAEFEPAQKTSVSGQNAIARLNFKAIQHREEHLWQKHLAWLNAWAWWQ